MEHTHAIHAPCSALTSPSSAPSTNARSHRDRWLQGGNEWPWGIWARTRRLQVYGLWSQPKHNVPKFVRSPVVAVLISSLENWLLESG